ncbi:MAG: hypothetical protein D6737_14975 [Chloroflexi bacterium]|nr:MAG: hypothetical protein CUN54_04995 [Phototrophicales bacterium]RMF78362.1 MAG: hypothetical protein D6737_14975 [Chloroflexota bacterium]
MDIQHLIDRLEDLIDEGRHIPMSKHTMIDEERALEIIDQMRISIPEEIEKAARILAQRDHVLAQANEEAARIVQNAREQGMQLVDREAMVQAAQSRAANIIEEARQNAESITGDTDQYILNALGDLQQRLDNMLKEVHAGIEHVHRTSFAPQQMSSVSPEAPSQSVPEPQFAPPREAVEIKLQTDEDSAQN